jgi:hypothetical protein
MPPAYFTAAMRTHAFTTIITPTRSSPIPSQQHNKFVEFGLFSWYLKKDDMNEIKILVRSYIFGEKGVDFLFLI